MALSINTNVASLQAQFHLSQNTNALSQNQERLASGLRINSAADDAAGLAISDRMTAQIRGMNQAARNANNGISLIQTAQSGLNRMTDILNRMRELSVQASNETATDSDRDSINSEFQKLSDELNRIAQEQSFNGKNILDGTLGQARFQVGPDTQNVDQITVDMNTSMESSAIGGRVTTTLGLADATTTSIADGELTVNGQTITNLSSYASDATNKMGKVSDSAYAIAKAINDLTNVQADATGVTTTGNSKVSVGTSYTLSINGVQVTTATADLGNNTLIDAINAKADKTGVTAELEGSNVKLISGEGRNITINETGAGITQGLFTTSSSTIKRGNVILDSSENIALTINSTSAISSGAISNTTSATLSNMNYIDSADVTSFTEAQKAITKIDTAINDVDSLAAELGSAQNRMEFTIENLNQSSQNLSEARSRILDADIAKEAAEMTQNNVRRQAASAVLAQANQNPQLALQLLGG